MTIVYHNPDCGTSRNTRAMIRQSVEEPEIIEHLKNPSRSFNPVIKLESK